VEDGTLQTPGPLIRVAEGTELHISVRNQLPIPVTIHGLFERGGEEREPLKLAPGETKAVQFLARAPGTYLYWGQTSKGSIAGRTDKETMLSGAFIIDPRGAAADDRVFVLQRYNKDELKPTFEMVNSINGKSWPDTERLNLPVGKVAHWRVLNASDWRHPMHLHGFYFRVDGVSDDVRAKDYSESEGRMVVTELVEPAHAFVMSWIPERPGNWLFHCHLLEHMGMQPSSIHYGGESQPAKVTYIEHPHALGMSGLVLGITVHGNEVPAKATKPPAAPARQLHLYVRNRPASSYIPAGPGFYLDGAANEPGIIGPALVLTRGEPTAITVTNELNVPTAIHWHGIELESYYDGVAGWTGSSEQVTPAIAPGSSFVALMTPPRAGTFIYHTHWHEIGQLVGGLYGPLIVVEPGEKFGPATDKVFIIGRAGSNDRFDPLVINGSAQPLPARLVEGQRFRLRFINITPNDLVVTASLFYNNELVTWKALAKDGAALLRKEAIEQPSQQRVAVGETYDFEFTPQFARDETGRSIRYRLNFLSDLTSIDASQWFIVRPAPTN
jgi:FtsP/CotA-like multicopper oxidase with cupredoxin domain